LELIGVDWYISYEMAADSARGEFERTPPPTTSVNRVKAIKILVGLVLPVDEILFCHQNIAIFSLKS
jgi:hypothetical protein